MLAPMPGQPMNRARFDEYIARFNASDKTAFEEFLTDDMQMINGTLEFTGVSGMTAHYSRIWSTFTEQLTVGRFVSDADHVAIEMDAHFVAHRDDPDSTFGPVRRGEVFDFSGIIMYDVRDGRFSRIRVAYNTFLHTTPDGVVESLGIPH
jgi:hypothetical protein